MNDTVCKYIYDTNVESVKRFSQEINELIAPGNESEDNLDLYTSAIFMYNRIIGEKDSVVTFYADVNENMFYSNPHNENYLLYFLEHENNLNQVKEATATHDNGKITMTHDNREETFYYHAFSDGHNDYTFFIGIDYIKIEAKLNVNKIVLPICLMGFLLLIVTEYAIWLKTILVASENQVKGVE